MCVFNLFLCLASFIISALDVAIESSDVDDRSGGGGEENFGWWTLTNKLRVAQIFDSGMESVESIVVKVNSVPPVELGEILCTLFRFKEIRVVWRDFNAVLESRPDSFVEDLCSMMQEKLHAYKFSLIDEYIKGRFSASSSPVRDKMKAIAAVLVGLNWKPSLRQLPGRSDPSMSLDPRDKSKQGANQHLIFLITFLGRSIIFLFRSIYSWR